MHVHSGSACETAVKVRNCSGISPSGLVKTFKPVFWYNYFWELLLFLPGESNGSDLLFDSDRQCRE